MPFQGCKLTLIGLAMPYGSILTFVQTSDSQPFPSLTKPAAAAR